MSRAPDAFSVRAFGRSPYGPERVRLEVEVARFDEPLDGVGILRGDWVYAPAGQSVELVVDVRGLAAQSAYRWRARIGYDTSRAHPTAHSRWYSGGAPGEPSRVHVRTRANGHIVAVDDTMFAEAGVALLREPGVIANDVDPEGDRLTARKLTEAKHGVVTVGEAGAVIFYRLTDPAFFGEDSFDYEVSDGLGQGRDGDRAYRRAGPVHDRDLRARRLLRGGPHAGRSAQERALVVRRRWRRDLRCRRAWLASTGSTAMRPLTSRTIRAR